jgi:hypothetical protein
LASARLTAATTIFLLFFAMGVRAADDSVLRAMMPLGRHDPCSHSGGFKGVAVNARGAVANVSL